MELVDGVIPVGDLPAGWAGEPAERRRAGLALIDVLVQLHRIEPGSVGLADFGRPDGFLARQVRRWTTQWESWRDKQAAASDRSVAAELGALAAGLGSSVPEPQRSGIVHGDYRIDNVVYHRADPGRVLAVLDWEMSTLGDQVTDLGLLMIYWHQADDPPIWRDAQVLPSPTRLAGFPTRTELASRYADRTGIDLSGFGWYAAFGAFKLAVVLAGILARVRAGAVPAQMAHGLERGVEPLVALGRHLLDEGLG
jgi:aminoglycoside phosphotransferase (APT) family kinase protein